MAKPKAPLISLKAHGTIADSLTFQKRGTGTIARVKPTPTDRKTLPQMYHRWLYYDYSQWWHTLTEAQQEAWETNARRLRITGFNYWMRTKLNTLPDILGMWRLDERGGSIALDFSNHENHGTIYGAAHCLGRIDHALSFDGSDDYVNCQDDPSLFAQTFSLEAFAYPTQFGIRQGICGKQFTGWYEYGIFIDTNNHIKATFRNPGDKFLTLDSTVHATQAWWHILLTYDEGVANLYINGDLKKSDSWVETLSDKGSDFFIGKMGLAHYDYYWFKGIIDQVDLRNRILTTTEIKSHSERRYPL